MTIPTHVVVGIILNADRQVLISYRHPGSHQGGLWEFPGGKLESGESAVEGLKREFSEELGIYPKRCFPLKKILYHYPEKSVLLDVWRINEFRGHATGMEGQPVEWRHLSDLNEKDFPPANSPIIRLLKLPEAIAITSELKDERAVEQAISDLIAQGVKVIQFRQGHLDDETYLHWFNVARLVCCRKDVELMFNHCLSTFSKLKVRVGFHANSARLMQMRERPVSNNFLFSASCHNLQELKQAEKLDVDFVYLSPVKPIEKYSEGHSLDWQGFETLVAQVSLPVYALGGMTVSDVTEVRKRGGQGIAGIRCFRT
jgi:8-oxo-dGTP diphosphatase